MMATTDIIEKLLLKRIRIFSFLIRVCIRCLFAWWWWSKWIFHREFLSKARTNASPFLTRAYYGRIRTG